MAKVEIFRGPLARLFPRLGAFPVRRREADAESLETARTFLAAGGLVVVFPEGTCVDEPDALGSPHHGAGRLGLETGVPIVPTAIVGTHRLWLGPIPKPRRVRVAFHEPVAVADLAGTSNAVSELIDRRVWPAVEEEYGRLRATSGLVAAALIAVGLGGLVARRLHARSPTPRLLGIVEPRKLRRIRARRSLIKRVRGKS
jgi:1-acyl-sn-glycerol-3-phosphate acyltransferase